ncbi:glycosyltransferase family 4 protein [Candidatus Daviesbacteria bacterium]|nr:glycosyltransferase family 4 protein [Candidatus Daviesbacteria bacterium]
MVIGFDGSRVFEGNRTGTENYSYQLLKALAKIDNKNQYIVYVRPSDVILGSTERSRSATPGSTDSGRAPIKLGLARLAEASAKRARMTEAKNWPRNFAFKVIPWPRFWTQGGLAFQTFKDRLDVLFVPAHTLPLVRRPGLKTVVTVHDLGSEYLPSMHQVKQRVYLGLMQKFQLKTATKIIAVSKATKEDLVKRIGIDPEKVSVIYEGYDRSKFKIQNSKFKIDQTIKKYNLEYQKYFLFVGTVQPRKNLERLIKAFSVIARSETTKQSSQVKSQIKIATLPSQTRVARNDNVELVIAGSKGWMSDEIYALPKKLGIEEKVKFLGYVPEEDLPALYCGAIALTFPSLFEGFGLPILEAQACGCPVLTSNVSSMPEVAGKGAVYVNPYSVEEIAEGMKKVQSAKCKVQSVKAGLENVKRFSWEKCAEETLKVLEKCK